MIKRELLSSIIDPEIRVVAAKFLDKVMQSGKYHEKVFTAFLSPLERDICEKLFWKCHEDIHISSFGGYEDAEYQMIGLSPSYTPLEQEDFPLKLIMAHVTAKTFELSHRDILGALMALGFKRNRIGDLSIVENEIQIICDLELADYISSQLEKIGRYSVTTMMAPLNAYKIPAVETEEQFKTVPSLRLDAVLAAGLTFQEALLWILFRG